MILGIKMMHFGVSDTMHDKSIEDYSNLIFNASITKNKTICFICLNIINTFFIYSFKIKKYIRINF